MTSWAFSPSAIRSCGWARTSASVFVLMKLMMIEGTVKLKSESESLISSSQGSVGDVLPPVAAASPVPVPVMAVARERDPEVEELLGAQLQQLDVEDDLGLRLVVHLDEPLGHGDLVGRVADDDRVELRDRRHPPQVEEAADHRRDVLHVAVREEERPDDLVLVLLAVLLRVLRDEDRLLVDDLVEVPRLPHRRLEGLLERQVPQVDRELVVLQLRVEDDVDPGRGAEGLVDLLDRRVGRERDVDRLVRGRVQHRRGGPAALRLRLGLLGRRASGGLEAARLDLLDDPLQLLVGDVVRRVERDALLELHLREVELPRRAVEPSPSEVRLGRLQPRAEERRLYFWFPGSRDAAFW